MCLLSTGSVVRTHPAANTTHFFCTFLRSQPPAAARSRPQPTAPHGRFEFHPPSRRNPCAPPPAAAAARPRRSPPWAPSAPHGLPAHAHAHTTRRHTHSLLHTLSKDTPHTHTLPTARQKKHHLLYTLSRIATERSPCCLREQTTSVAGVGALAGHRQHQGGHAALPAVRRGTGCGAVSLVCRPVGVERVVQERDAPS